MPKRTQKRIRKTNKRNNKKIKTGRRRRNRSHKKYLGGTQVTPNFKYFENFEIKNTKGLITKEKLADCYIIIRNEQPNVVMVIFNLYFGMANAAAGASKLLAKGLYNIFGRPMANAVAAPAALVSETAARVLDENGKVMQKSNAYILVEKLLNVLNNVSGKKDAFIIEEEQGLGFGDEWNFLAKSLMFSITSENQSNYNPIYKNETLQFNKDVNNPLFYEDAEDTRYYKYQLNEIGEYDKNIKAGVDRALTLIEQATAAEVEPVAQPLTP
jgi:hypothetical protein